MFRFEHESKGLYVGNDDFIEEYDMLHNDAEHPSPQDELKIQMNNTVVDGVIISNHMEKYYTNMFNNGVNPFEAKQSVSNDVWSVVDDFDVKLNFINGCGYKCFFNSAATIDAWFTQEQLRAIIGDGFKLREFTFLDSDFEEDEFFQIFDKQSIVERELSESAIVRDLEPWWM